MNAREAIRAAFAADAEAEQRAANKLFPTQRVSPDLAPEQAAFLREHPWLRDEQGRIVVASAGPISGKIPRGITIVQARPNRARRRRGR